MEFGCKNHNGDGLLGPNSIIVLYMDPLGVALLKIAYRNLGTYTLKQGYDAHNGYKTLSWRLG